MDKAVRIRMEAPRGLNIYCFASYAVLNPSLLQVVLGPVSVRWSFSVVNWVKFAVTFSLLPGTAWNAGMLLKQTRFGDNLVQSYSP